MLNKIKAAGLVSFIRGKDKNDDRELLVYFSLLVVNPNGVKTLLRCRVSGTTAHQMEKEVKKDELIEVKGYLRNETIGRQIIIQVLEFSKLETVPELSNHARLLGTITTDLEIQNQEEENKLILSFKVEAPTKENKYTSFFCRSQGLLTKEIANSLQKGDVILVTGFLQTKRLTANDDIYGEKIERISSLICQSFVLIDTARVSDFYPLDKLSLISKEVEKIDFTKPR